MEKEYTWFIEPLDGMTNEALANELPAETNFLSQKLCGDGEKRELWECRNFGLVRAFIRSASRKNYKFKIFLKEDKGDIWRWNLYPPPPSRPRWKEKKKK